MLAGNSISIFNNQVLKIPIPMPECAFTPGIADTFPFQKLFFENGVPDIAPACFWKQALSALLLAWGVNLGIICRWSQVKVKY